MVSDGLSVFRRVKDAGCSHEVIITGSGPRSVRGPAFKWVNTALGIKSAIVGTYRSISSKHVPRYPAELSTASTDDTISLGDDPPPDMGRRPDPTPCHTNSPVG